MLKCCLQSSTCISNTCVGLFLFVEFLDYSELFINVFPFHFLLVLENLHCPCLIHLTKNDKVDTTGNTMLCMNKLTSLSIQLHVLFIKPLSRYFTVTFTPPTGSAAQGQPHTTHFEKF
jgi:hypothetical protein